MENINTILEDADKKYNVQKLNQQLELEQDSLQIKEILGQDVIIETDKVIRNAIKNGNIHKHKDGSKYIIEEIFNLPINNIKYKELNKYNEKYQGDDYCIIHTIMNNLESIQDINITHLMMEDLGKISHRFDFCVDLIFPPFWIYLVFETIRYTRMRSRGYLPITLTVIFEKKESKDIAIGLPVKV